jgi:hypothetical protein
LISLARQFATEQVLLLLQEAFDVEWPERVCECCNEIWAAAPDHGFIHGLKGWDVLCDLVEWPEEECVVETPIPLVEE